MTAEISKAPESYLDQLKMQSEQLRNQYNGTDARQIRGTRPQSASRVRRSNPNVDDKFRIRGSSSGAKDTQPRRPASAKPKRGVASRGFRNKRSARVQADGKGHPEWVVAALRRKKMALGSPRGGSVDIGREERVLIDTYGSNTSESKKSQRRKGGRPSTAGSTRSRAARGQPWEMYDKEEQYHRILTLRSRVSSQELEIKSLRMKLIKAQREQAKTERNVEKSMNQAARVMATLKDSDQYKNSSTLNFIPSGTANSDQRILNRMRAQLKNYSEELSARDVKILELRKSSHYARVTELETELDEYRNECFRLKDTLEQVLRMEQKRERDERAQRRDWLRNQKPRNVAKEDSGSKDDRGKENNETIDDLDREIHMIGEPNKEDFLSGAEDDNDFIDEEDMRPEHKYDSNESASENHGYDDDFENIEVPARAKSRRSGSGRPKSSIQKTTSFKKRSTKFRRPKRGSGKGSRRLRPRGKRTTKTSAAHKKGYKSNLNALATTIASLCPGNGANPVSYARFVQDVALDLDAQYEIRNKNRSHTSYLINGSAGVNLVPVSEFCASLGRVALRNFNYEEPPEIPESVLHCLLDKIGATKMTARIRGGNYNNNSNGHESDYSDDGSEEYVVDYTKVVSELLVRVDMWALFGGRQQISALPDQIAVVVDSQQSRIQMQQSQINTLLEDAKQAKARERELKKEIEALLETGGRGNIAQRRLQKYGDEPDLENDGYDSEGEKTKWKLEGISKQSKLKNTDVNADKTRSSISQPSRKIIRPASASRKRPPSASRVRRPTSERSRSASSRIKSIPEKVGTGLTWSTSVSSPIPKNGGEIDSNSGKQLKSRSKSRSENVAKESTNPTPDKIPSSNIADTQELSLSASRKSAARREKLLLRRQQLLEERAKQLNDVQMKREKKINADKEKRKLRQLHMESIEQTTASLKETQKEEELLVITGSPQKNSSSKTKGKASAPKSSGKQLKSNEHFNKEDGGISTSEASGTEMSDQATMRQDIKNAVTEAIEDKNRQRMLMMTREETLELENRFRSIIRRAVASGAFLNRSFTENDSTLNVEAFTKNIIETDHLEGTMSASTGNQFKQLTKLEIEWFLSLLDANGDGRVDYREFLHFTYNSSNAIDGKILDTDENTKKGGVVEIDAETIKANLGYEADAFAKKLSSIFSTVVRSGKVHDFRDIFHTMDDDRSGRVSHDEFVLALKEFNFNIPPKIEEELLRRFDVDGDGEVNYLEFVNFCLAYSQIDGVDRTESKTVGFEQPDGDLSMTGHQSPANRLRLALCEFVEREGGSINLYMLYQKLSASNPDVGVTIKSWLRLLEMSGNGLKSDEAAYFENHFSRELQKKTSSSRHVDNVDYMTLVKFMYPFREVIRWDGDMTTLYKLRRIVKVAKRTGTIDDYISAAKILCGAKHKPGDPIKRETFQEILRNFWLDLSDANIDDILQRLLPNVDGTYTYEDFLAICEVESDELKSIRQNEASKSSNPTSESSIRKNLAATGVFEETDDENNYLEETKTLASKGEVPRLKTGTDGQSVTSLSATIKNTEKMSVENQTADQEPSKKIEEDIQRAPVEKARANEEYRQKEEADKRATEDRLRKEHKAAEMLQEEGERGNRIKHPAESQEVREKTEWKSQKFAAIEIQKQVRARQARLHVVQRRSDKMRQRKESFRQESAAVEIQRHVRSRQDVRRRKAADLDEDAYSDSDFDEGANNTGESEYGEDFESGTAVAASQDKEKIAHVDDQDDDSYATAESTDSLGDIMDEYADDFED